MVTKTLTIDVTYRGGSAGQAQDSTVAAVDVFDSIATQWDIHVEGEKHSNTQQSDEPGQGAAGVQPSRCHDSRIPEWFTNSNVPAEGEHCQTHNNYPQLLQVRDIDLQELSTQTVTITVHYKYPKSALI